VTLLLDSTVLIDFLRGRTAAGDAIERRLRHGETLLTTGINVEEVVRGLRPPERPATTALFDGLIVVPIGRAEGWKAGQWRADFAARGITLSQADCLIAAVAFALGATLATGNPRDFPIDGLSIEHWPVG